MLAKDRDAKFGKPTNVSRAADGAGPCRSGMTSSVIFRAIRAMNQSAFLSDATNHPALTTLRIACFAPGCSVIRLSSAFTVSTQQNPGH